ncbi:hypothetical protein BC826DRAFT_1060887 [Russula brevipes]|nr:hypothetical protein BC826DRAFT_1060887 [Russula brevipes]
MEQRSVKRPCTRFFPSKQQQQRLPLSCLRHSKIAPPTTDAPGVTASPLAQPQPQPSARQPQAATPRHARPTRQRLRHSPSLGHVLISSSPHATLRLSLHLPIHSTHLPLSWLLLPCPRSSCRPGSWRKTGTIFGCRTSTRWSPSRIRAAGPAASSAL